MIAYNYIVNVPGWWDISVNHGPHNMLNLIEGNVFTWYKDDGYFGSSSHNTLFRNRIDWEVSLKHFSNYYNIVGNVLGTAGLNIVYEAKLRLMEFLTIRNLRAWLPQHRQSQVIMEHLWPNNAARLSHASKHAGWVSAT